MTLTWQFRLGKAKLKVQEKTTFESRKNKAHTKPRTFLSGYQKLNMLEATIIMNFVKREKESRLLP